jgi:uncharacterized protein involved in exopolysaccharide biosynthesis
MAATARWSCRWIWPTRKSTDIRPADVDNLIAALETRREATRERIQTLTETLGSDEPGVVLGEQRLPQRIESLTREIIDVESQLESELATREADRRELEATRDRAWDAYQALTSQLVEAEIQAESSNTEVRVADVALTPEFPVGSGAMMNSILAAIVAVMLAVGAIVFPRLVVSGRRGVCRRNGRASAQGGVPASEEPAPGQPQPEVQVGD